jgi:hypothetical protein
MEQEIRQEHIAFYVNDVDGKSIPFPLMSSDGILEPRESKITSRKHTAVKQYVSPLGTHGFPGVPFESGEPNPAVYSQGEDIIFDTYLYYAGKTVSSKTFKINVIVKSDPHQIDPVWLGSLNNGLYPMDREGYYEIWIPSSITSNLFAGSYYVDITITEPVGTGKGTKDRTIFLLSYNFSIEYTAASPNPESAASSGGLKSRDMLQNTWPNAPGTIGR